MENMPKSHYDCLEYPKTCAPNDFWGQVRRTVNGKPLPDEQINMIFSMVRENLQFQPDDVVLDLGCGNGALAVDFFDDIQEYLGVDMSPYLVEVGEKNFQRAPTHTFRLETANDYCVSESAPERFTKVLWYGAFAYFSVDEVRELFLTLRQRFSSVERVFIGTIPETCRAKDFFKDNTMLPLDDHTTAIGRWWSREEVARLAEECGWNVTVIEMPDGFFQSHYRFNVVLTPKGQA